YDYFQLCIENLAAELKKIQDAGVPVIFRPLHEAEGNPSKTDDPIDGSGAWFWWSKEGADVYKKLWDFLRDELQNKYGIHNLIWEQNLYTWSDASAQWYSGDDKVDIVGYDKYNTQYHRHDGKSQGEPNEDAEAGIFYNLYDTIKGKKIIAMAENDSIPSLSNMEIEHAYWSYFCPWYDSEQAHFVMGEEYQNVDTFTELYKSDFCITLDELPADLYGDSGTVDIVTTTTTGKISEGTTTTTTTAGDSNVKKGDANEDGNVSISDCVAILQYLANGEKYALTKQGLKNADVDSEPGVTGKDAAEIQKFDAGLIKEFK
ncbi:MAG: beta-mannosidase, partial [Ruminococcus sp.]|nr:beta-mannosidase [Ruminococcus sp.]